MKLQRTDDGTRIVMFTRSQRKPTTTDGPETTNTCSVVALFSALLGLFLPALVLGFVGFRECGRRPNERGDGLAIMALVLGFVELLMALFVLWVLVDFDELMGITAG